jgi:tetratricopeptide (TPR) repeat protein
MPMRRTQDVVKVVMTDHLIQRRPAGKEERLAPLKETLPIIVDAMFPDPAQAPPGALGEVYRVVAIFRAGGGAHVVDRLETMLDKAKPPELLPYFDLARGQLNYRRFVDVENTLKFILAKEPDNSMAYEWMGIARNGLNQKDKAIEAIRKSLKGENPRAEAHYNLGRLLFTTGNFQQAVEYFSQALKIRPTLVPAWYHLGNAQAALNQVEKAIQSYKWALEISPSYTNAYLELGRLLLTKGNRSEALRYWRHGVKVAVNPKPIAKALAQYSATQKK